MSLVIQHVYCTAKYVNIFFSAIHCCHLLFLCSNYCFPLQTYNAFITVQQQEPLSLSDPIRKYLL